MAEVSQVSRDSPVSAAPTAIDKVARGGFFNLAGSVVSALVTMAFTVVITHGLSQTSAGTFFALSALFNLAFTMACLGVPTGIVYFISRYRAQDRVELLRPTMIAALVPVVTVGLLIGAAGLVLAHPLAEVFIGHDSAAAVDCVRVLSVFIVAASVNDVLMGSTRGYGVMRPLVFIDRLGRPILELVLIGLVVLVGWRTAAWVGLAWAGPYLPAALVFLLWSRQLGRRTVRRSTAVRGLRPGDLPPVSWRAQLRPFWRFTLPRTVGSIAQMVLQRADVVLIGAILGPVQAAIYTAATRFLVFGQLGGGAISSTIQPRISALLAKNDRAGAAELYRIATVWLMLLTWPIYLLFAVFSTDLLRIFGRGYAVGDNVIIILSLAMLVATACGAVDVVLVMAGHSAWTMTNSLCALAVDLVLNIVLIPRIGIVGAALAWAAAILINNLAPLTELALWLRLHPFGRATVIAAGLPAVCFAAIPLVVRVSLGHRLGAEIGAAAVGAIVYLAGLWTFREPLQLAALASIRRRRTTGPAG
jgi:O-antigen/teichoic acid export membrane protein